MCSVQVAVGKSYPFDMPTGTACDSIELGTAVEVLACKDYLVVFSFA